MPRCFGPLSHHGGAVCDSHVDESPGCLLEASEVLTCAHEQRLDVMAETDITASMQTCGFTELSSHRHTNYFRLVSK